MFKAKFVTAFIILLFATQQLLAITKHALIFAIGNYNEKKNGWMALESMRDADMLKKTLQKQHFDDIRVVKDAEATVQGISKAFEKLINEVKPGDIVVVHFSCHGRRIATTSDKVGGYDQSIVTINAVNENKIDRKIPYEKLQAEYYRGQLLGAYMKKLRAGLGKDGDLVMFLDYCHSGAATRGIAKVRGGAPPLVPEGYVATDNIKGSDAYAEAATKGGAADKGLASYVVFSACRPEETDQQCRDDSDKEIGSLTYAVCKAFENLDSATTYRSFFAKVEQTMNLKAERQQPLLEGNGTERGFLGGKYFTQKTYVTIDEITDSTHIVVNAGLLAGLNEGAKIMLAPAGTIDPANATPLAKGTVTKADNFKAVVALDKEVILKVPSAAWVFITEPVFKVPVINVRVVTDQNSAASGIVSRGATSMFSNTEAHAIEGSLTGFDLASFAGSPEVYIAKGPVADSLIRAENGYCFDTISNVVQNGDELKKRLKRYAQYKYLANIEMAQPGVSFDVKLFKIVNGVTDTTREMYDVNVGDSLALWVKNTGTLTAYINILDMQPDGIVNAILPNKRYNVYAYNLKYEPGESHNYWKVERFHLHVSPPYGKEMLKVFASINEINLENVATTRGTKRGGMKSIEMLVNKSFELTRGLDPSAEGGDCTTSSVTFSIHK